MKIYGVTRRNDRVRVVPDVGLYAVATETDIFKQDLSALGVSRNGLAVQQDLEAMIRRQRWIDQQAKLQLAFGVSQRLVRLRADDLESAVRTKHGIVAIGGVIIRGPGRAIYLDTYALGSGRPTVGVLDLTVGANLFIDRCARNRGSDK